jgi:DnaJ-domain-containing protein 1
MPEKPPLMSFLLGLANPGVPAELWSQLRPWLQRFALAVPKHAAPLDDPQYCEHVTRSGNGCEHMGVLVCRCCGESVCLKHSYVNGGAQCVCAQCIASLASASREEDDEPAPKNKRSKKRKEWKPPQDEYEGPTPDERVAALELLGLTAAADQATINARFRELSRTHHPDRFTNPRDTASAEEHFKKLSAAYSLLNNRAAA